MPIVLILGKVEILRRSASQNDMPWSILHTDPNPQIDFLLAICAESLAIYEASGNYSICTQSP